MMTEFLFWGELSL